MLRRRSTTVDLIFVFPCHGLSYWIDDSCKNNFAGVMEATVLEAIDMGSKGQSQMADAGNAVMTSAFEQIFKVPTTSVATLNRVSCQ